jgi:hypothetical protein
LRSLYCSNSQLTLKSKQMKKDQSTNNKVTKKVATSQTIQSSNCEQWPIIKSHIEAKTHIVNMIKFERIANDYIYSLSALFNNNGPDNFVGVNHILAEVYGIPHMDEEVYNIYSANKPNGIINIDQYAEITEKEILELHVATVEPSKVNEMVFTKKTISTLLESAATVWNIIKGIEDLKCLGAESSPFECRHDPSDLFNTNDIAHFIFFILGGAEENDNDIEIIYNAIDSISFNPDEEPKELEKKLIDAVNSMVKLMEHKKLVA